MARERPPWHRASVGLLHAAAAILPMMPLGNLFVHAYVLGDDALRSGGPSGTLVDQGFRRRPWAASLRARGSQVVTTPSRAERRTLPAALRRPVAVLRNRMETAIGELTDLDCLRLARHGTNTVWGLLTRTAATILAHALQRLELV